jgi:cell pole-organizing protein PopZ
MNKPEPTGGKSLEDILASIRKSLADEPPGRQPELPVAPAKATLPHPKPAQPARAADTSKSNAGESLAGKLAAGLNGAPRTPPASDDDLSDLLATAPTKPVRASVDAPKPPEARNDAKDPLWFLSRLSATATDAARARDAAEAPAGSPEEVKLSRPETLRPSLPPLFGAGSEPIPPAAPREDIPNVSLTAKTEPRNIPRQVGAEAATAKASQESGATTAASIPPAATVSPPSSPQGSPIADNPAAKDVSTPSSVAFDATPTVSPTPPQPVTEIAPLVPGAQAEADTPAPAPATEAAPAPSAEPVSAPPPAAFEQVVGQLLEPVIRQWLHSNLPRLIEKAVREEVVRALAAERDAAKG